MPPSKIKRFGMKGVSFIALVLLAIGIALAWERWLTPTDLVTTDGIETVVRRSEEPIQPLPLSQSLNPAKVALGDRLFHDPLLSKDNGTACIACHGFDTGGTDRLPHSIGWDGQLTLVNTPTIFNTGFNDRVGWSGQFDNLAHQADAAVTNAILMGSDWDETLEELKQVPEYVRTFAQIYPDGVQRQNVTDAIAVYEESLSTPNSRFDRYLRGDETALSAEEEAGYEAFKAYGCVSCHQGANIGGNLFQPFGVLADYFAWRGEVTEADYGRYNITGNEADRYVFRVPSLRNVALTPPYFHDGTVETLREAVEIMAQYQLGRPLPKPDMDRIVQFLETLNGELQGEPL
jgi:cytochrome c peroxidase